jgi:ribosomal protein S18 acetylase RimI-like enzyme
MAEAVFRRAVREDLEAIVWLLGDDPLGSRRERLALPLEPRYVQAFDALVRDPNQLLAVAADAEMVAGCLQLTFVPGLSRLGMWRGQIESVRIAASHRGGGLGRRFLLWAIDQCRERGCGLVQLTTDKTRPDALRFYESLGFEASHHGLKLNL